MLPRLITLAVFLLITVLGIVALFSPDSQQLGLVFLIVGFMGIVAISFEMVRLHRKSRNQ